MECGWPQYGIPVLAPLRINEFDLDYKKGIFETLNHVFRLKIAGLNDFNIQKFKLNVITSKITFDFLFKNIDTTAQKYDTDTLIDALRQLGLSVEYEGSGELLFDLVNLRIAGTLKYKLPMLWGSAKITSLKTTISLESVTSTSLIHGQRQDQPRHQQPAGEHRGKGNQWQPGHHFRDH